MREQQKSENKLFIICPIHKKRQNSHRCFDCILLFYSKNSTLLYCPYWKILIHLPNKNSKALVCRGKHAWKNHTYLQTGEVVFPTLSLTDQLSLSHENLPALKITHPMKSSPASTE